VPAGEIERWEKENDPIDRYMTRLTGELKFTQKEIAAVDARVRDEVDRATEEAEKSPFPEPLDGLEGIYADPPRERPLWFREGGAVVKSHERAEGWGTWSATAKPSDA
jgi:TPP-dependent pyruvate/acetoin dehydrogenase alpha subunit